MGENRQFLPQPLRQKEVAVLPLAGAWAVSTAVFLIVYLVPRSVLLPIAIGLLALFFVLLLLAIRKRRQGILALCLAAAGMAMAFFWCANYEQQVMVPAETLYGQTLRVTVQILDWPKETDYGISVEGRLVQGVERPLNVMLYLDEAYIDLEPGDQIETVVRLTNAGIIMGEQNDYYTSVGISLKAVGYGPVTKLESSHSLFTLARKMAGSVRAGLERCFPEDVAPVIQALVTGDKGKLDDKFYTALKRSGLAHTVAVSGMHVMFLVGMLHFLLRHRKRAAVISILVIVFFALMVPHGV